MSERNGTIDIFKLLASFCIISVHIGYYQDYPVIFADLFRVSTRWALPFFFVSSGYFLGLSSNTNVIQRVNKLITIFLTASIFYSAVLLLKNHNNIYEQLNEILSFKLLRGIYFHLWFIPSLIIGLIGASYLINNASVKKSIILSFAFILFAWIEDVCVYLGKDVDFIFAREVMSIGLVYLGYATAKLNLANKINKNISISLSIIFICASLAEVLVLQEFTGISSKERQFPLLCSFAAISILIACSKVQIKEGLFSELGKKYSLPVYLYHPLFISASRFALGKIGINDSFAILITTFTSTLLVLIITDRYLNPLFRLINGDIFRRKDKEGAINS